MTIQTHRRASLGLGQLAATAWDSSVLAVLAVFILRKAEVTSCGVVGFAGMMDRSRIEMDVGWGGSMESGWGGMYLYPGRCFELWVHQPALARAS
jgi:hypothetical protein